MSATAPNEAPFARDEPVSRYSRTAMVLHWLVAALLLVNVVYGLKAASADDAHVRPLVDMHKSIGLTILGLVLLRIFWRLGHKPPPLPRGYPGYEKAFALVAHFLLYAVMLLLPLTGYIHDSAWKAAAAHPIVLYGLVPFPRIGFIENLDPALKEHVHSLFSAAHTYLGYALYGLFALHLAGVAKHHAIDHESELSRMLPGGYRRPDGGA